MAVTLEQCWHEVPGGTARAALELVRHLSRRHHVDLIGLAARHRRPPPLAFQPPIVVRRSVLPRLAMYEAWHRLRWPRVEGATGPIDVVHATGIAVPPTRVPLVSTLHDLAFLPMPEMYTPRGNSFFRRALELTRRHAAAVCVPSRRTWEDCVEAGISEDRLTMVPLGVDARPVADGAVAAVRERFGVHRPFVLFCGTHEPRKNLARLVRAYGRVRADHPDVDLVLVGPSGWHADRLGLDRPPEGVHLLGFVPSTDLDALYAGCLLFAFPSVFEGFGLPVIEAMSQGARVLTGRGTATEEVAGGLATLVDPLDEEAMTEALRAEITEALGADPLTEATDRARRSAHAGTYTWDRTAELTEQIYAALTT
ncbi:MAG: glycosyltransferase family 1 protein [Microthrixaceae bacterium]